MNTPLTDPHSLLSFLLLATSACWCSMWCWIEPQSLQLPKLSLSRQLDCWTISLALSLLTSNIRDLFCLVLRLCVGVVMVFLLIWLLLFCPQTCFINNTLWSIVHILITLGWDFSNSALLRVWGEVILCCESSSCVLYISGIPYFYCLDTAVLPHYDKLEYSWILPSVLWP